jgi:hypothetical protein
MTGLLTTAQGRDHDDPTRTWFCEEVRSPNTLLFEKYLGPLRRGEASVGLYQVHMNTYTLQPAATLRYGPTTQQEAGKYKAVRVCARVRWCAHVCGGACACACACACLFARVCVCVRARNLSACACGTECCSWAWETIPATLNGAMLCGKRTPSGPSLKSRSSGCYFKVLSSMMATGTLAGRCRCTSPRKISNWPSHGMRRGR